MPFGLCNSPQSLCRLMDKVIPARLRENVFVYLDDLLIFSENFDSHIKTLSEVASCLRQAGLTIKLSKCKFCRKQVKYLGYIVGDGTLKTDPGKVECVVDYPRPTTVKQLRRFLGMAGWYRRFISNFAEVTTPLTNLLKKCKTFQWNEEAQAAFEILKTKLSTAPILSSPDYSKPFMIQCDASKLGIGGVLVQQDENGAELPIAYFSQNLNKAQSNYSVTELECLAAILSLKKFRAYVEGQDFKIITDHASLKWLMDQKDLAGRLARWAIKLQGFVFKIEHRKGSENVVPDCLSRQFEEVATIESFPLIDLQSSAFTSNEYTKLKDQILQNQNKLPDLKVIDNQVYKRTEHATGNPEQEMFSWKLWVPKPLINEVIHNAHTQHNKCHGGITKTLGYLRKNLYWPNMTVDVKEFIAKCDICHSSKSQNTTLRPPMLKQFTTQRPFQKLYIDLLGPYPRSKQGNIGLFIVLDALTKFVLLKPIKKFTAEPICEYLKESVFSIFGTPEIVVSDNGKQFKSVLFKNFLEARGIKHQFTALYSPQANASERVNRSIITGIRSYLQNDQTKWDSHIPDISEALRSAYHQSTGFSPYYVLFGQQMISHAQDYMLLRNLESLDDVTVDRIDKLKVVRSAVQENIKAAFEASAKRYNLRSSVRQYNIGDTVYRRNFTLSDASKRFSAKLAPKFIKARITSKKGNCAYELRDVNTNKTGIYHLKDIKPIHI